MVLDHSADAYHSVVPSNLLMNPWFTLHLLQMKLYHHSIDLLHLLQQLISLLYGLFCLRCCKIGLHHQLVSHSSHLLQLSRQCLQNFKQLHLSWPAGRSLPWSLGRSMSSPMASLREPSRPPHYRKLTKPDTKCDTHGH
jgi:hypothetical protein